MAGRKQKPYQTSWGEIIPGLAHDTSGRWRVVSTGFRFTEADERRAMTKFRELQPAQRVQIDMAVKPDLAGPVRYGPLMTALTQFTQATDTDGQTLPKIKFGGGQPVTLGYDIDPVII